MGFAGTSNTMSWYLHVSQGGRASALWYSVSAARSTNGRPCDWFDTHPDLYLRIIADGISNKNSSLALTIGLMELTARSRAMQEFSFQVFEAFAAATVIYLIVNLLVVLAMRKVESKVRVYGYIGTPNQTITPGH